MKAVAQRTRSASSPERWEGFAQACCRDWAVQSREVGIARGHLLSSDLQSGVHLEPAVLSSSCVSRACCPPAAGSRSCSAPLSMSPPSSSSATARRGCGDRAAAVRRGPLSGRRKELGVCLSCLAGGHCEQFPAQIQLLEDKSRLIQKQYLDSTFHSAGKGAGAKGRMLRFCSGFHEWMNVEMQVGIWRGFGSLLQDLSGTQST